MKSTLYALFAFLYSSHTYIFTYKLMYIIIFSLFLHFFYKIKIVFFVKNIMKKKLCKNKTKRAREKRSLYMSI